VPTFQVSAPDPLFQTPWLGRRGNLGFWVPAPCGPAGRYRSPDPARGPGS